MAEVAAVGTILIFVVVAFICLRAFRGPRTLMTSYKINWTGGRDDASSTDNAEPAPRKPYRASYGAARARTQRLKGQEDK